MKHKSGPSRVVMGTSDWYTVSCFARLEINAVLTGSCSLRAGHLYAISFQMVTSDLTSARR